MRNSIVILALAAALVAITATTRASGPSPCVLLPPVVAWQAAPPSSTPQQTTGMPQAGLATPTQAGRAAPLPQPVQPGQPYPAGTVTAPSGAPAVTPGIAPTTPITGQSYLTSPGLMRPSVAAPRAAVAAPRLPGPAPAAVTQKPFSNYTPAPVVSPYINLYRDGNLGVNNYYTWVQPMLQQQAVNQQNQARIGQLMDINRFQQTQLQQLQQFNTPPVSGNHVGTFMDTQGYFPGLR